MGIPDVPSVAAAVRVLAVPLRKAPSVPFQSLPDLGYDKEVQLERKSSANPENKNAGVE